MTVHYAGNDNIAGSEAEVKITINKRDWEIDIYTEDKEEFYGDGVFIEVYGIPEDVTGKFTVTDADNNILGEFEVVDVRR